MRHIDDSDWSKKVADCEVLDFTDLIRIEPVPVVYARATFLERDFGCGFAQKGSVLVQVHGEYARVLFHGAVESSQLAQRRRAAVPRLLYRRRRTADTLSEVRQDDRRVTVARSIVVRLEVRLRAVQGEDEPLFRGRLECEGVRVGFHSALVIDVVHVLVSLEPVRLDALLGVRYIARPF